MLGSSSLAVIGFYVAILNLQEIRIRIQSETQEPQPDTAAAPSITQRD